MVEGRLYLDSAKVLRDNPPLLMKIFWYALKKEARLSQETIRLVKQCLFLADENFQRSEEVSRLFLEIIGDLKTSRELLDPGGQTRRQAAAGLGDLAHRIGEGDLAVPVVPNPPEQALGVAIQAGLGGVDGGLQIGAGVDRAQDARVLLEVVNQGVLEMRDKHRVTADRPLEGLKALPGDPALLELLVKPVQVPVRVKGLKIGLAEDDVVRRGVVMEFLVPFFEEVPGRPP